MKKTLEQQYKEETGLNAYESNNMRPNIPEDVYVEWLEDKIEQLALCNVSCQRKQLFIFYKELQKAGRLYNDNLSEDIMKKEIDWFVKNK